MKWQWNLHRFGLKARNFTSGRKSSKSNSLRNQITTLSKRKKRNQITMSRHTIHSFENIIRVQIYKRLNAAQTFYWVQWINKLFQKLQAETQARKYKWYKAELIKKYFWCCVYQAKRWYHQKLEISTHQIHLQEEHGRHLCRGLVSCLNFLPSHTKPYSLMDLLQCLPHHVESIMGVKSENKYIWSN